MIVKRDEDFDEEDNDKSDLMSSIGKLTIIIGIIFLILTETFFYLLSQKTGAPFGLTQIIFALILAIIITLFLGWIRIIIRSNKHAGLFMGIVGTASIAYALNIKFQGTYTTIFTIIGSVLMLGYIIIQFWKSGKK